MQKKINISNYEEFLIDFLDGNLDKDTHAMVLLFLEQNPIIAEEFDGIYDYSINECVGAFNNKESLKVQYDSVLLLNNENYEHYFIAYHEGDLSFQDKIQVEDFLELNPDLVSEFGSFKEVSSIMPENIVFESKEQILRLNIGDGNYIPQSEFENICIDFIEGNLNKKESDNLLDIVAKDEKLNSIFTLYNSSKLTADTSIVFGDKQLLYRNVPIGLLAISRYVNSMAAAIAFFVVFNIYSTTLDKINTQIEVDNKVETVTDNIDVIQKTNFINKKEVAENSSTEITKNSNTKIAPNNTNYENRITSRVVMMESKGMETALSDCHEIELESQIMPIQYFVIDTGCVVIVATEPDVDGDNSIGKIGKIKNKISRIYSHEKEYIANTKPKDAIRKITEMAVKGFNKMTESEILLSQKDESLP
ncbi:MAG: hypothetical protein KAG84_06330 [Bacteroidales bacterium]|nr:hypothetical protein [Bacteroidales bacterium]